ncbi:MAG TPA: ATP-binding protein, partial [Thermodesulfovibrionales bacterium]|nr:ATP-binding protein [Thermodesulfovibrionales bacterium]
VLTVKTYMKTMLGNEFAAIDISDTGYGLKRSKPAGLPASSRRKGRGLGLFITREIVQSNGGHLEIISDDRSGTTVKLFFPVMSR